MADISDLIIKMRADAADVEQGFNRASASLDQFINKLKTPQVLKVSVVTSFATVAGATGAAKIGQMFYDQADAAEKATTAVEKYKESISKEMTGAYDAISAGMEKQTSAISSITMAIFRDSANATAAYSDYMNDLIERNAGSWFDFAESVGTAVGWVTKGILSVAATLAWLGESATIILDDLYSKWMKVWDEMKRPVTELYNWAVEKLGWILDSVKWLLEAVGMTGGMTSTLVSPEAMTKIQTSFDALKKGVSGIWDAKGRAPHEKVAKAAGGAAKTDKYVDTDEAYLRLLKEQVKFYDGVTAGLRQMRDEKLAIIDADQKMLDIERLVSLSEEDYLKATLGNLEAKVQAQRDLISARLQWSNIVDAKDVEELERQEKLLEVQKRRVQVEEMLRRDPVAGTTKALADLSNQYQSTGKLMEDYTRGLFMSMEGYFAAFCDTGKFEFKDFVRSALINLNTLLFKIAVLEPMANNLRTAIQGIGGGRGGGFLGGIPGGGFGSDLFSLFGGSSGMFFAKGAAFESGNVTRMARGSIVNSPTVFPMASGMGLMGEAGPEAVIPLKRTASGDLGVQGGAGGSTYNITINANDAQSFYEMCRRNPSAITDPVERALQGNQSIRRTIMRTAK